MERGFNLFRDIMLKGLNEQYYDLVTDRIQVRKDDLTENEIRIIEFGFELMNEKL